MQSYGTPFDYSFNLVLIGDTQVGKSALLLRFHEGGYNPSMISTIGVDFRIRTIEVDGKRVKLRIWDTAGQEKFRAIGNGYYRQAQGIVIVYDVTSESSFRNVVNWMQSIDELAPENVCRILLGNKCDMTKERVIETAKGRELADKYGVQFFETSAKTGHNVEDAFRAISREIRIVVDTQESSSDILASPPRNTRRVAISGAQETKPAASKKGCCWWNKLLLLKFLVLF